MSFAAELHQAHKERLARIDHAAAHRTACVKAAQATAKTADLEKYLSTFTKVEPPPVKPTGMWFGIVEDLQPDQIRKFSITEIQRATCRHFGITPIELLSRRRTHKVVIPRQIAIYLCKKLTTRSLPEIGRMFGGMDHTTVLHAVRVTEKRMRENWTLAFDIAHIEASLA